MRVRGVAFVGVLLGISLITITMAVQQLLTTTDVHDIGRPPTAQQPTSENDQPLTAIQQETTVVNVSSHTVAKQDSNRITISEHWGLKGVAMMRKGEASGHPKYVHDECVTDDFRLLHRKHLQISKDTTTSSRESQLSKQVDAIFGLLHRTLQVYEAARKADQIPLFVPRKRTSTLKIAMLTLQEGAKSKQPTDTASLTKIHYAKIYNYSMLFDSTPYSIKHGRHPTWNRIPSLQKHLPHYDWIYYIDDDIAIANASVLLEDFIHQFSDDTRLSFTNGKRDFNAGSFFIKNDEFSYRILSTWWKDYPATANTQCGKAFSCLKQFSDQYGIWDTVIQLFAEHSNQQNKVNCKTMPGRAMDNWGPGMDCYTRTMNRMGYPVYNRSYHGFYLWNSTTMYPRGFTFFWPDRKALYVWPEDELFTVGDFVIHTHENWLLENYGSLNILRAYEQRSSGS